MSRKVVAKKYRQKTSLEKLYKNKTGHKGFAKLIRQMHRDGYSVKEIEDEIGCNRHEIDKALTLYARFTEED